MPPIYDYTCNLCKRQLERNVPHPRADKQTCEVCGGCLTRLLSAPRFRFKGGNANAADQFTAERMGMRVDELPSGIRSK